MALDDDGGVVAPTQLRSCLAVIILLDPLGSLTPWNTSLP